jgi:hypothetical protein
VTQIVVASVVEGHGEVAALPVLLRRVFEGVDIYGINARRPHRLPRGKFTKDDQLRRAVDIQSAAIQGAGGVIVLADADDDCPVELRDRCLELVGNTTVPLKIIFANREFEGWYLAGIESLRDHRSVREDAAFEGNPESTRDAKGHLERLMNEPYRETLHQAAFAAQVDLDLVAERSPSFQKFRRDVEGLTS